MKKIILSFILFALSSNAYSGPIPPGPSGSYISNTASPQVAQFNVGTGTIRGNLTVGTLTVSTVAVTTMTATQFIGGGNGITNLNATQLLTGTIPAAVIWHGTPVGTQYGGTGLDWSGIAQGRIPYFSGTGTFGTVAAGTANQVLASGGPAGAPAFTGAPTVLGTNVTAIPVANLAAGTLSVSIVASSVANSGVTPGIYGGPAQMPQVTIAADGRITSASQSLLSTNFALKSEENIFTRYNWFTSSITVAGNLYASGTNLTGVIYSTAAIVVRQDAIAASTGVLTLGLADETAAREAMDTLLNASTTTLTNDLATEVSDREISVAAVAVDTGTLTDGLAAEIIDREAADSAIAVSTGANAAGLAAELLTRAADDLLRVLKAGDTMSGNLNMGGKQILNVSTISPSGNSVIIRSYALNETSDDTYATSIGYGSYNNNNNGIGIGHNASGNFDYGIGIGLTASNNHTSSVGIGNNAHDNRSYSVGIGGNAYNNFTYSVGVGYYAHANASYAVGVGAYSANNKTYGTGIGAYAIASSSSVALGSHAQATAKESIAIGAGTVNNSTGTASFGVYAVTTSSDVTATKFYGDGSTLTGVVKTAGDTMTGTLTVSTATTSSASLCLVGAVATLPTTGYAAGCIAYLTTAPTSIYISTETVVSADSWLAK